MAGTRAVAELIPSKPECSWLRPVPLGSHTLPFEASRSFSATSPYLRRAARHLLGQRCALASGPRLARGGGGYADPRSHAHTCVERDRRACAVDAPAQVSPSRASSIRRGQILVLAIAMFALPDVRAYTVDDNLARRGGGVPLDAGRDVSATTVHGRVASGVSPKGLPADTAYYAAALPAPLNYTILLASDSHFVNKCVYTSTSLREQSYARSIHYVTETMHLTPTYRKSLEALNVTVLDLATILDLANPGAHDSQWTNAHNTPRHCDFWKAFNAHSPPRSNSYDWDRPSAYADKRAKGWRGYWLKALSVFNSYWSTELHLDRVMYVDCGVTALASTNGGAIDEFFSSIDSTGKLIAQDDWLTFGKDLRDGSERACNTTAYDEQWRSADTLLLGDGNEPVKAFNSAMMIYDTALLGTQNAALREITQVFNSPIAGTVSGDQEIFNLYFGPLGRNVWTNVPKQRPGAADGSCFYAYSSQGSYQPCHCTTYLMVKNLVGAKPPSPPSPPARGLASPKMMRPHVWGALPG